MRSLGLFVTFLVATNGSGNNFFNDGFVYSKCLKGTVVATYLYNKLKVGMERKEVFTLTGQPIVTEEIDGKTFCFYQAFTAYRFVLFDFFTDRAPGYVLITLVFDENGNLERKSLKVVSRKDPFEEFLAPRDMPILSFANTKGWFFKGYKSGNGL